MYDELRTAVVKTLKNSSIFRPLLGWTKTVNKEKHLCFVMFQVKCVSVPFFWKSVVLITAKIISIPNGKNDFLEDKVKKETNWVKRVSPNIADHLKEHYLRLTMQCLVDRKIQLKAFRKQLLMKNPTSGAAVEKVFSRQKLVHSRLKSCLNSDIFDKRLFVSYNIVFLYPGLAF